MDGLRNEYSNTKPVAFQFMWGNDNFLSSITTFLCQHDAVLYRNVLHRADRDFVMLLGKLRKIKIVG